MREPSEVCVSLLDKERMCIRLASNAILVSQYPENLLLSELRKSMFDPFKGAGMLAYFLIILFSPLTLYDAIKNYIHQRRWRQIIESRENNHVIPIQNLPELWGKYGLSNERFVSEEHALAECLSVWLKILYGDSYFYSTDEITKKFHAESARQGRLANSVRSRGGHINMEHWHSVVVRHIVQDAPPY